jgi:hypothetical protein
VEAAGLFAVLEDVGEGWGFGVIEVWVWGFVMLGLVVMVGLGRDLVTGGVLAFVTVDRRSSSEKGMSIWLVRTL